VRAGPDRARPQKTSQPKIAAGKGERPHQATGARRNGSVFFGSVEAHPVGKCETPVQRGGRRNSTSWPEPTGPPGKSVGRPAQARELAGGNTGTAREAFGTAVAHQTQPPRQIAGGRRVNRDLRHSPGPPGPGEKWSSSHRCRSRTFEPKPGGGRRSTAVTTAATNRSRNQFDAAPPPRREIVPGGKRRAQRLARARSFSTCRPGGPASPSSPRPPGADHPKCPPGRWLQHPNGGHSCSTRHEGHQQKERGGVVAAIEGSMRDPSARSGRWRECRPNPDRLPSARGLAGWARSLAGRSA